MKSEGFFLNLEDNFLTFLTEFIEVNENVFMNPKKLDLCIQRIVTKMAVEGFEQDKIFRRNW